MRRKRLFRAATAVCLVAILVFSLSGCLFNSDERFETFTDELFAGMFTDDGFSVNFLIQNPESFGLENEKATISVPSSKDEYESGMSALSLQSKILKLRFRYKQLTDSQKVLYDYLVYFFNFRAEYADYYYFQDDFIGSYLGFQASLPIYLAEYKFNSKHDIDNYFNLIEETATAFPAYFAYEQERVNNGYGRADFVYEGAIEQCENFTGCSTDQAFILSSEQNFLVDIFDERVSACGFLTESEKTAYSALNVSKINSVLLPAYHTLGQNVRTLVGNAESNQQGMYYYEGGQAYYKLLFKNATGTDDSIETAKTTLTAAYNAAISEYLEIANQIYSANGLSYDIDAAMEEWLSGDDWTSAGLTQTLSSLQSAMAADFPALAEMGQIILKSVPESLKDNYSPAAYFTSYVDSKTADHVILVNSYDTSGYFSYDLMAHEGLPGHLYQDAYFKNIGVHKLMLVLGQSSYKEGWATYIQDYISKYYQPGTLNNQLYRLYLLNNKINQLRVGLIDIWVNYDGYTREQLVLAVNSTFGYNFASGTNEYVSLQDYCGRVFEHVIEVPTNVLKYYYTAIKFQQLQDAYRVKQGSAYSDLAFHTAVMQYGALPIQMYFNILI